jgi:hypothetical protein
MSTPGQDALKRVNFFVIGAAKCGTTTLYARLNAHPEVFLSPLKEPNFYSRADLDPARFSKAFKANTKLDLTGYLAQPDPLPEMQVGFVQSEADYARLFSGATNAHRVVGECSTSYLWSPSAPEALHAAHPDAKIVVALRDPVERIFSHYLMARKYGFVKGSVVEAVKADLAHPDPSWGRSELFVELSLYEAQIARWRAFFPDAQLRILEPGALRQDETWHDLQTWLGLTPRDLTSGHGSGDANTAGLSRFEVLNRWLTSTGLKQALGRLVPSGLKSSLLGWYYRSDDVPTLTDAERAELTALLSEVSAARRD